MCSENVVKLNASIRYIAITNMDCLGIGWKCDVRVSRPFAIVVVHEVNESVGLYNRVVPILSHVVIVESFVLSTYFEGSVVLVSLRQSICDGIL